MTMAISTAVERGAKVVICASTGNTSASAAAYAARAGLMCAVVIPEGHIALGKLAQALIHGARVVPVHGNFDDALEIVRELGERPGVEVVNSVNPVRIEGQKTAAFEIVDVLGDAPTVHCLPVGNAGNITAYWRGYSEYHELGRADAAPRACSGGRPAGAAPIVRGEPVLHPETIATAIQIGNPASWEGAIDGPRRVGRAHRRGHRRADPRGLPHARRPTRAASSSRRRRRRWPGCSQPRPTDCSRADDVVVCTVTGHGLKDPQRAIAEVQVGEPVDAADRRRSRSRSDLSSRELDHGAGHRRVGGHRSRLRRTRSAARGHDSCSSRATRSRLGELAPSCAERVRRGRRGARRRPAHRRRARTRSRPGSPTPTRPVDLLVNNAGFGTFGRFAEPDVDARSARSSSTWSRSCASPTPRSERWCRAGRGAILNVSSLAAYQPTPTSATYGATKAFVNSFTHAVHEECRRTGVHVMLVCPGYTHTEFHERAGLGPTQIPEFVWQSADDVVGGRAARPRPGPRRCRSRACSTRPRRGLERGADRGHPARRRPGDAPVRLTRHSRAEAQQAVGLRQHVELAVVALAEADTWPTSRSRSTDAKPSPSGRSPITAVRCSSR